MQYSSSIAISIIGGCQCILGQKDQLLQNEWLHAMAITARRLMHLDEYSISCTHIHDPQWCSDGHQEPTRNHREPMGTTGNPMKRVRIVDVYTHKCYSGAKQMVACYGRRLMHIK